MAAGARLDHDIQDVPVFITAQAGDDRSDIYIDLYGDGLNVPPEPGR